MRSAIHGERAARNALGWALSGGVSEFEEHTAEEVYGGVESARCFWGEATGEKSPSSPLVLDALNVP